MSSYRIFGLLAETHIHAGEGQRNAAVDLPISREHASGYPYIAGASLKGALRMQHNGPHETQVFGPWSGDLEAGRLVVADARLLLLPVRSNIGACCYVTCPSLLSRLRRDLKRMGQETDFEGDLPYPDPDKAFIMESSKQIELEELEFGIVESSEAKGYIEKIVQALKMLGIGENQIDTGRIAIVNDNAFAWLARTATPVRARNRLDPATKTVESGALWYEETLAPETVMTMILGARAKVKTDAGEECPVKLLLEAMPGGDRKYFQVGGNETVGQGWMSFAKERIALEATG